MTISSDRPLNDFSNDFLNYKGFSSSLANSISMYKSSDPLIIGLYGPWGVGKSTILNMTEKELELIDLSGNGYEHIVVKFNPWWFTGQENMAKNFIAELSKVLPEKDESLGKLGSLMENYSDQIGAVFGFATSLIPVFGQLFSGLVESGVSKASSDVGANLQVEKNKSIEKIKCEIQSVLKSIERKKIVIFIDDVDRLLPNELVQLFSVVKGFGDFYNTIYIMACDKTAAEKSLKSINIDTNYMDKIVQIPFNVPSINLSLIHI